ncbi:PAS domain S-box protein [Methanosphaerula palustris]|uniref:Putative PAS/PAC sensor protein n=1 Tax=Methanosphaerula palustris (strain ATCC BAA-1556 / DSM 19958 / E1-9c) TaxID=521011 RepID=B8GE60_METPE|nr:PAS domain S-box protein [Methanosphaerula palustris]ACL17561.1 putative PAS/PAC sensor protein [Methanosphaerula palustris E1-9c]
MIQNNQRLDLIRELLSAHPQGLSVTEIAAALGVNKNSTGRSLDTLYAAGEIRMRRFGMAKLYTSAARMPLSAMMSLLSNPILIADADQTITFINDPFLSLLNLTREQVINRHITTVRGVAPDIEGLEAAFDAATEQGEVKEMIRFSGEEERIFLRRCVPVTLETDAAGTAVIMKELTAQIRAEQALHEQENQFTEVIENLQDIYYQTDQDEILTYANRQILPFLGYDSMDQVLGHTASSFWAEPEKRKKFLNLVRKRGAINDFETSLLRADGSQVPISTSSHLRFARNGEVLGLGGTIRDISWRKKNEEKIQVLSAHNRAMIEANLDPIVSVDRDGLITDVNEATVAITGYPREQLIGSRFNQYFADQIQAEQLFGEVVHSGQIRNRLASMLHADGHRTPALCNAALCRNEDGTISGIFVSLRDITDQEKMDRDLTRNERMLQMTEAVFTLSEQPIVIGFPDGGVAYANPALCRMLGFTEKELKALDWRTDLTSQEWQETDSSVLEKQALTGEPQKYRKELLHKDGYPVPVEIVMHLIRVTRDQNPCFCCYLTDISRDLQAAKQRAAGELRFQHFLNAAPIGVLTADSGGRIVTVNRRMARLFGHSSNDLEGRLTIEVLEQADLGEKHRFREILINGAENIPVDIRQKDGRPVEMLLTVAPVTDQQNQYQGMVGFLIDQTKTKKQERILIEAGRRISAMIDQVPLIALKFDRTGELISCNDALIATTGWTRNQVLGRDWHRHLVPPGETGDRDLTMQDLVKGDQKDWTGPVLTADGRKLQIRWTCLMLLDDQQQFEGTICLGEEVTEQRQLAVLLSRTEEEYQDLIEINPYPTVLIDADWTITRVNREFTTALHYTVPERPKKLTFLSIVSPENRPAVTMLLNEEVSHATCTLVQEDGRPIIATIRPGPCRGDRPRMLVLMIDQV